jgi:hypothetical protein
MSKPRVVRRSADFESSILPSRWLCTGSMTSLAIRGQGSCDRAARSRFGGIVISLEKSISLKLSLYADTKHLAKRTD